MYVRYSWIGLFLAGCAASPTSEATTSDELARAPLTCSSTGKLLAGRRYCVTSAGGVEMKVAEPLGAPGPSASSPDAGPSGSSGRAGPLRIALYLHGDGAGAYKSDGAMKALLPWADANHALVVSVLAPNRCAWWQLPTQTDCSETATPAPDVDGVNADALKAVIDTLKKAYDIADGPLFYYGSSGGSIFLTRSFLRRHGDEYPGIFALNCGGERADRAFAWKVTDPIARGATKLVYTYGDKDYLRSDIEAAIPFYETLGFPSESKIVPGAEHCAFDGHARAAEVWTAFLDR